MTHLRNRSGRAAGVFILGIIGGILGALGTNWVTGRWGAKLPPEIRPYTQVVTPPPANPETADQGAPANRNIGHGDVIHAVQRIGPAVAAITTEIAAPPSEYGELPDFIRRFFGVPEERRPRGEGRGSGFIVNGSDGYLITNHHVVQNASRIQVKLPDKREFDAELKGADPYNDVAVLRISGASLPQLALADSDKAVIGSTVVAIGNPFGLENSVTTGVVSAVNRELPGGTPLENLIQTDAAINPGNSGGPLCDLDGNVVGMNTAITAQGQGIGFAVASNTIKSSISQILRYGRATRAWMGIATLTLTPEVAERLQIRSIPGAVVGRVEPGSPAEEAGLRVGDVITAIEARPVKEQNDVRAAIRGRRPEDTVTVTVKRGDQTEQLRLRLGEAPLPRR
jgi:S1-C subfamily serine protease